MLNIIDEFTHECLAIRIDRKLKSIDVIDVLSDLFVLRGVPEHIRSDNGPEFVAKVVQEWITAVGARTAYIALGSPWENGFIKSFKRGCAMSCSMAKSYSLDEARIVIESWQRRYNAVWPRKSLGYKPPAPEVCVPALASAGGYAIPASYAARASIEAVNALTFTVDPSVGAGHEQLANIWLPKRCYSGFSQPFQPRNAAWLSLLCCLSSSASKLRTRASRALPLCALPVTFGASSSLIRVRSISAISSASCRSTSSIGRAFVDPQLLRRHGIVRARHHKRIGRMANKLAS